jgi:hypothetical protein
MHPRREPASKAQDAHPAHPSAALRLLHHPHPQEQTQAGGQSAAGRAGGHPAEGGDVQRGVSADPTQYLPLHAANKHAPSANQLTHH